MDFAGPFLVKIMRRLQLKHYVAIFSCMLYRAVHLELVEGLSADQFKMAFARFTARRGRPGQVNSDNGSNLKAGEIELLEERAKLDVEELRKLYPEITWHFNTPTAAHQGGHFERKVGAMNEALYQMVDYLGEALKREELATLLAEAEAVMNLQPLVHPSTNMADC